MSAAAAPDVGTSPGSIGSGGGASAPGSPVGPGGAGALPVEGLASSPDPFNDVVDCAGPAGDPEPETPEWDQRERENRYCAQQGTFDVLTNPAYWAALGRNYPSNLDRPFPLASRDPFRSPDQWDGERGRFDETTFTDRDGNEQRMTIFRPLKACGADGDATACPEEVPEHGASAPYPAVLIFMYSGNTKYAVGDSHFEQAQTLAEHGYMVGIGTYPAVSGSGFDAAPDALEFFLSTPDSPNEYGEINPLWRDLDRTRVGLTGLSGNGRMALEIGFDDPRIDAIVAWDPASSTDADPDRAVPALIVNADYGTVPTTPEEPSGRELYEELVDRGYDAMQIVKRAGTHVDSGRPVNCKVACSRYGGAVLTYYTLAWFDRYLFGDEERASEARSRLLSTEFDGSADASAIGMGRFDVEQAIEEGDLLAGNQPVHLEGMPVANRLSFYYPSRYHLDEGALACENMRDGLRDGTCIVDSDEEHRRGNPGHGEGNPGYGKGDNPGQGRG